MSLFPPPEAGIGTSMNFLFSSPPDKIHFVPTTVVMRSMMTRGRVKDGVVAKLKGGIP
jgi:hypothetical protein